MTVDVIIPAFNESSSIARVLADIPKPYVRYVIVVDNASTDGTAQIAENGGALVCREPIKGYGQACLRGIDYIKTQLHPKPDVLVFLDGDYADYPDKIMDFIQEMIENPELCMVIGSRVLGHRDQGALTPQQIFGNWLATRLIRLIYNVYYTDLGPFRAIRWGALMDLNMEDKTYGWTVEMQIKVAKKKWSFKEIPINYRKRIGTSKISGTLKGTVLAGYKILYTIFRYGF